MDFFDRSVAAQEGVFRTTCAVAPDAEKPCLKTAPATPTSTPTESHSMTTTLTERQKTGLQATYQAEAMLRVLLTAAHHSDLEELPSLLQAMLPRLMELNSVSMSAHEEGSESVESMADRLCGGYAVHAMGKSHPASKGSAA